MEDEQQPQEFLFDTINYKILLIHLNLIQFLPESFASYKALSTFSINLSKVSPEIYSDKPILKVIFL
jgi:hypothetical protein